MNHRNDIDGLRAVAVIAVILFHAGVTAVSGGFAGVDVFFVISGFLISTIILRDMDAGRFSIARFYERRIRRIFPAFGAVMIVATPLACWLMFPSDLRAYGRSLLANSVFASNVYFWHSTGYFDEAQGRSLLHTWSLGVEEQFYLAYPLFLLLIARYGRKRYLPVLSIAAAAGFVFAVWTVRVHPAAGFYFSLARAWELLSGAMLAAPGIPAIRSRVAANLLSGAGLLSIVASFVILSPYSEFPGINALPPCLGAALVIYGGRTSGTLVARVLSLRPLVFVGLISYSLYLWHWVLLVFARYAAARGLSAVETTALVTAACLLSALSWRFIETPFRAGRWRQLRQRVLFRGAAVASAAFALTGLVVGVSGLPERFNKTVTAYAEGSQDIWSRRNECAWRLCAIGTPGPGRDFLLWGDSHAAALAPALDELGKRHHLSGRIAFAHGCAPLLSLHRYDTDSHCEEFADSVLAGILSTGTRHVILEARWSAYAEGVRYGNEEGPPFVISANGWQDNFRVFRSLTLRTLARLRERHLDVTVVGSVPEAGEDVPLTLADHARWGGAGVGPASNDYRNRQKRAMDTLQASAGMGLCRLVRPDDLLCETDRCIIETNGRALYSDSVHLSVAGARFLEPMLDPVFSGFSGYERPFSGD